MFLFQKSGLALDRAQLILKLETNTTPVLFMNAEQAAQHENWLKEKNEKLEELQSPPSRWRNLVSTPLLIDRRILPGT